MPNFAACCVALFVFAWTSINVFALTINDLFVIYAYNKRGCLPARPVPPPLSPHLLPFGCKLKKIAAGQTTLFNVKVNFRSLSLSCSLFAFLICMLQQARRSLRHLNDFRLIMRSYIMTFAQCILPRLLSTALLTHSLRLNDDLKPPV